MINTKDLLYSIMCDKTEFERGQIMDLYQHASLSNSQIAKKLGIARKSVARIVQRFNETGTVETFRADCGRVG